MTKEEQLEKLYKLISEFADQHVKTLALADLILSRMKIVDAEIRKLKAS